eukprot:TRINITY_DN1306_c2_g3_i1.p1 TRINITY_DN1306_c2_g3~~TRINITY_DN1306_c2_g3_i1.p1  ORF type:complete len:309 (-),score=92.88 TRINITY_DN1306_c2_g3_i1:404-1330(-)
MDTEFLLPSLKGPSSDENINKDSISKQFALVMPGEPITTQDGFLRGHGTYTKNEALYSSVSGFVEKVNKLITVKSLNFRYSGDVGDVVVGRISEVGSKRWKVEINARQEAILMLSSINLPGGVLRRRTAEDALKMRNFFVENDLICAEVQMFFSDGSISLQTRTKKYGKLTDGQFISVPAALIKRCKTHFHSLSCGVDVILGNNGYCWICPPSEEEPESNNNNNENDDDNKIFNSTDNNSDNDQIDNQTRIKISRVYNSIKCLVKKFIAIYPDTIMSVYNQSLLYQPKEMLKPNIIDLITVNALEIKS